MKTTIDLSPEAYLVAKSFASESKISLSSAVSQLILGTIKAPPTPSENDDWPSVAVGQFVTVEGVKNFLDEDE